MDNTPLTKRNKLLLVAAAAAVIGATTPGVWFGGQRGYADGRSNGYWAGYQDGWGTGYETGFTQGAETLRAPRIRLIAASYTVSGCGLFGPYYRTFSFFFTLINTGNASGFATVTFYVNSNPVGYNIYFVPAGSQVEKASSVNGPDHGGTPCPDERPSLAVTAVEKG